MNLRLFVVHTRWMLLELLRQPSYLVSTIAFPALFFWIFAIPESKDVSSSNFLMASFSGFAVFGVIFLQFGVGMAQGRSSSWSHYLKTLPVSPWAFLIARFTTALIFAFAAALAIVVMAVTMTEARLAFSAWSEFVLGLFAGGIAICFMGLALGYWAGERSALPIGNLIYLPLTFAGGLWKPPNLLPDSLKTLSTYLPTRLYGEVLWATVQSQKVELEYSLGLVAYAGLFGLIAWFGYRRDADRKAHA
jgi:ABC-2 type transport system permease protein